MMRLARPPSLPFNYTHLFLHGKCSQCSEGVQIKVITQKAEPVHDINWGNCPRVSLQGTGEILSEQTEEFCLKGSLVYWPIVLSKPIGLLSSHFFVGPWTMMLLCVNSCF